MVHQTQTNEGSTVIANELVAQAIDAASRLSVPQEEFAKALVSGAIVVAGRCAQPEIVTSALLARFGQSEFIHANDGPAYILRRG